MVSKVLRNLFSKSYPRKIFLELSPVFHRKFSQNLEFGPAPTMEELAIKLAQIRGIEPGYSLNPPDRSHLSKYLPEKQSDLPARSMKDSYLIAFVPLSSEKKLQDKYTTFCGTVRVGRLLEDMDLFAVVVAEKHLLNPRLPEGVPSPQALITAQADRINFTTDFAPNLKEDIRLSGHVSWVGRSSMEVVVWLAQKHDGGWNKITSALFLIAARDPAHYKAAFVNTLAPTNAKEKHILERGDKRKLYREATIKQHVSKTLPDPEEQKIVHELYMKTKSHKEGRMVLPPGGAWMEECKISNTIFSQPEYRNLHNTVFGGFIMRQAAELSWVLGCKFSKHRPKFRTSSDMKFTRPIAMNSVISMEAIVVFTHLNFVQISVFIERFLLETGVTETTNMFHFTFEVPDGVKDIYPKSYHEAMLYIDGRRHFKDVMQSAFHGQGSFLNEEGIIEKN